MSVCDQFIRMSNKRRKVGEHEPTKRTRYNNKRTKMEKQEIQSTVELLAQLLDTPEDEGGIKSVYEWHQDHEFTHRVCSLLSYSALQRRVVKYQSKKTTFSRGCTRTLTLREELEIVARVSFIRGKFLFLTNSLIAEEALHVALTPRKGETREECLLAMRYLRCGGKDWIRNFKKRHAFLSYFLVLLTDRQTVWEPY